MYVEDLLLRIEERRTDWLGDPFDGLLDDTWTRNFLASVTSHVMAAKPLSTKQSAVILSLIARVRHPLVRHGMMTDGEIDQMLRYPEFRRPLYESVNIQREVRYLGDNLLGFRFKQNDIIAARISELATLNTTNWGGVSAWLKRPLPSPQFDWDHRIWVVPVMRHTVEAVMAVINEYRFEIDEAVVAYLRLARKSREQPSAFVLTEGVIMANVCDNPLLAAWITQVADGIVL